MPAEQSHSPFDRPDLVFTSRFRVRYAETDPMGFVHNSNYLAYMEMGRIEALRHNGVSYRDLEERGFLIVVARASLDFKAPARMDDELRMEVTLARATRVRLDHAYRLYVDSSETLCLIAETTLACVDREGRIQAMPAEVLDTIDPSVPGLRR